MGQKLGPYRLVDELGTGGMGTVYKAEDDQGNTVALKVVHPHLLETSGFFKRFLREAEVGKKVAHQNVVRTLDCDALSGHHYLVMEYVEGQTIRELIRELGRVPEELCRHIGREVAKALHAIHEAGVVHRDLKPENVLITKDHVVKVMDLGVARLVDEAMKLSQTGVFIGSVLYAAPEQFGTDEPDHRSDFYALGLMLYELATGQHPSRADDFASIMRLRLQETPRPAGEVNPQLSAYFEEVVHGLLARDRDERLTDFPAEDSVWWRDHAQALRTQTKRPLRRIRIPRETALYGRDAELARLRELFESGDGQVVLIEGEAGIGKTRLVDEFVGGLGGDINFLYGSYPPGGAATAAGAFSTAYREQFGAAGSRGYLPDSPVLVPAFDALLKGEPPPKGEVPLTKESLQTIFVQATRALSAERPTVVLIDDLHFAPAEGRALFAALSLAVPGHRVLLVGTMRPGVPEKWVASVDRQPHVARLSLARLGPKDLASLLEDSFGSRHLAEELGFRIITKSDGNPFFAFEIIRGLREGQFITQTDDGSWAKTREIDKIEIPASVRDLIRVRIADLADEERKLLEVASCCGFEFDPSLVGAALGLKPIPALQSFGRIEQRHRLVRSAGRKLVFDHHQVQEALYEACLEQLREHYHGALADALLARTPEPEGAAAVELCEHLFRAARGEDTLPHLENARAHLEQGYLPEQELSLVDSALALPGLVSGAERVRLLLRKIGILGGLMRHTEERVAIDEAIALADEIGDPSMRGNTRKQLGIHYDMMSEPDKALATLEEAVVLAREAGDRLLEGRAHGSLGIVLTQLGRAAEARGHHERQGDLAREIGYRRGEAIAFANLGRVFAELGRYAEARETLNRCVAVSREIGNCANEVHTTINLGLIYLYTGCYAEAYEHQERARALAREIGRRRQELIAILNLGAVATAVGRIREARKHYLRCEALCGELGDRRNATGAATGLGEAAIALGRHGEARDHLEQARAWSREAGARPLEGNALAGLVLVAEAEGGREEVRRLAREALTLRREAGESRPITESLIALGRAEGATNHLDEALALARETGTPDAILAATVERARLPDGDVEAALAALAAHEERSEHRTRMSVRFRLWQLTDDRAHLDEAKRLLDHMVEHAPEEDRESMVANVPLYREIMEAAR